MGLSEQYSRADICRILDVSDKQLRQWEKLELVAVPKNDGRDSYDFRDLIGLRTAKQLLAKGVSPERLRRSLSALRQKLSEVQSPLTELRIVSNGKDVLVENAGARLEPISGQFILNFNTRELVEKVHMMPERGADAWFQMALDYDGDPRTRAKAIEAYDRVIALKPGHADALLNRGTLAYEDGDLEAARAFYERAVELEAHNAIARFNLGNIFEELGMLQEARQHLRLAVRLAPGHADSHYNLAYVCDKLGALSEAREHWATYIKLDPGSSWCDYARKRLASNT